MIVWVDDSLFSGNARDIDLIVLLRTAAFRRHTILISDTVGRRGKHPAFTQWRARFPAPIQLEIDHLLSTITLVSASAVVHGASISIIVSTKFIQASGVVVLSVDEAIRALALPLSILVENQINDGTFLRRVMPSYWADRIELWEKRGELRFVQGGGNTEIAKLINYHCDDDTCRRAFGLPSSIWKLTHCIVYDHDGEAQDVPGEGAKVLDRLGPQLRAHHRLWRRTQENYLPTKTLREIASRKLTDRIALTQMNQMLDDYELLGTARYFTLPPRFGDSPFFKNEFHLEMPWDEAAAQADGFECEMAILAEAIAAAI